MADHLSPEARSELMARVRNVDTRPEMVVRRLVHRMGYRFRLHRKDLPGTPDLVFPSRKRAILVHGCFWHQHGCRRSTRPKSNRDFWERKLTRNAERDRDNLALLGEAGWSVLIIWECETRETATLKQRIGTFLSGGGSADARHNSEPVLSP